MSAADGQRAARRSRLAPAPSARVREPEQRKVLRIPSPSPPAVLWRLLVSLGALAWVGLLFVGAAARRRSVTSEERSARLLRALQFMGPRMAFVLRGAATRPDHIPLELMRVLAQASDAMPPFPVAKALEAVQEAAGRPLEEVFEAFDPQPIASTVLNCVYRATLIDGTAVAVRVMRPDAPRMLSVERATLDWIQRMEALIFPSRARIIARRMLESRRIVLGRLNFVRRARAQRILRREVRKARLRNVKVARVYLELCSPDVIVSEYFEGIWLHEAAHLVETDAQEALAELARQGFDLERTGRSLLQFNWWLMMESGMMCTATMTPQLALSNRGHLVLVDVGETYPVGYFQRRLISTLYRRLSRYDMEGVAELLIRLISPLPGIDPQDLDKDLRSALWNELLAMENKGSPWWARSGNGIWLELMTLARHYNVVIEPEVAGLAQTCCVYGLFGARLIPDFRLIPELRRYWKRAYRRKARHVLREASKRKTADQLTLRTTPRAIEETAERAEIFVESVLEKVPVTYLSSVEKGAYTVSQVLGSLFFLAQVTVVGLSVRAGYDAAVGRSFDLLIDGGSVLRHPAWIATAAGVALVTLRKIRMRLEDVETDDDD